MKNNQLFHQKKKYKHLAFLAAGSLAFATSLGLASAAPTATNVSRLYSPVLGVHLQTIDQNEVSVLTSSYINGRHAWINETPTFMAYATTNGSCPTGTVSVYRLYNKLNKDHLLTADQNEANFWKTNVNWSYEGVAMCDYSTQVSGTVPVYRLYNRYSGEHLLTADQNEAYSLNGHYGWFIETADNGGVAFYAQP